MQPLPATSAATPAAAPAAQLLSQRFGSDFSVGLFLPLEGYGTGMPTLCSGERVIRRAEQMGFAALWVRDVPIVQPDGDPGQGYDPWVYLGYLAAITRTIMLATGCIVMPLRHAVHTAKQAASVDHLSGGRLVLGVGSGDRQFEYAVFGVDYDCRAERFRTALTTVRELLDADRGRQAAGSSALDGGFLLPPAGLGPVPIFATGNSGQSLEWIAENCAGWITYARERAEQADRVARWRGLTGSAFATEHKPVCQPLYIDLAAAPEERKTPIARGFRLGTHALRQELAELRGIGVDHIILNLRFATRPALEIIDEIGQEVLPHVA
jgi:luciferase-type oxidoreductase